MKAAVTILAILGCVFTVTLSLPNVKPPRLTVYFESLCPFSRKFIVHQLATSCDGISDLFTIDLVPYGNAKTTKDSEGRLLFSCQHGPQECESNKLLSCVQNRLPTKNYVDFTSCYMAGSKSDEDTLQCSRTAGVATSDWQDIVGCYHSDEASYLLDHNGHRTHKAGVGYVPWIELNGVHTEEINIRALTDLKDFICDIYEVNGFRPAACNI